jgi:FkbM family methyltransferase
MIPSRLRATVKDLATKVKAAMPLPVRRAMGRAGVFFGTDLHYPSMPLSLRNIGRLGFQPRFTVDVGAYEGEWTRLCREAFPETRILMVEAQAGKVEHLRSVAASVGGDIQLATVLLGPKDGLEVVFQEMETGSSVFPESSPTSRQQRTMLTRRLDSVLHEHGAPHVDFLKLDVQGYELEVLKGAPGALGQAEVVLLEASLMPVNAGAPPFEDLIVFMDQAGFRVFDVCGQGRRRDGVLWQLDLMFLRKGSRLAPTPSIDHTNWGSAGFY